MHKEIQLTVTGFHGPGRWLWRLTDSHSDASTEYEVQFDLHCEEYIGFADLEARLRVQVAPDVRREQEDALAHRIGSWITSTVLGDLAQRLAASAPCTVVLDTGEQAAALAYRPWELAIVEGRTLAERGVTFVADIAGASPSLDVVAGPLRMLAVYSQPSGLDTLDLREDRRELERLAERCVQLDLHVVQYGVTRDALKEIVADAGGWDVIHLAGHGTQGSFVLEDPEGRPDHITAPELVELLGLARGRTRLVTVSSCRSAAVIGAEHPGPGAAETESERATPTTSLPALAGTLAQTLGCAVLAMRFPVSDNFARALTKRLYELVIVEGSSLPEALDTARREAHRRARASALAWATPTLFGATALDLAWTPTPGRASQAPRPRTLPAPPERFLGRVATMTRCLQVLAARSASRTIVLHGMPGIGKSALAAELAHVHHHAFEDAIWFAVAAVGGDPDASLADFAVAIEAAVPDAELVHLIDLPDGETPDFGSISTAFGKAGVLLVVDNVEPLLAADGSWHDTRWQGLMEALNSHDGRSRLVITSRRAPRGLEAALLEPVHPLSPDETVLLAHQLPNLGPLYAGQAPEVPAEEGRALVRRVLDVTRGHPKILELAAGQAAKPDQLRRLLAHELGPDQGYAEVLRTWTAHVINDLGQPARKLLDLLCRLVEEDRRDPVVAALWDALGQPQSMLQTAINELTSAAMVRLDDEGRAFQLHPAIVQTGRSIGGERAQADIVAAAASYWWAEIEKEMKAETGGGPVMPVAAAARSAVPYLLDLADVKAASDALDLVLRRERSHLALRALLPTASRLIRAATHTTEELGARRLMANILALTGSTAAEKVTSQLRDRALAAGQMRMVVSLTSDLIGRYRDSGRLTEALTLAEQLIDLGRQVGVGPWTGLLQENQRLNIMVTSGQAAAALPEIKKLRRRMAELLAVVGDDETVRPYWVRELVLDTALTAALATEDWAGALEAAEEAAESKKTRGASASDIAEAVFRSCGPLVRLKRLSDAEKHLMWCRRVFTSEGNVQALAVTFATLAEIEEKRGRLHAAAQLSRDALRYHYAARTLGGVLTGHLNMGNRLARTGDMPGALAHHVAAALMGLASRHYHYDRALGTLAFDLIAIPDPAVWPSSVEQVCTLVSGAPGVDPAAMLRSLPDRGRSDTELLDEVYEQGRRRSEAVLRPNLAFWDPALCVLAAARRDAAAASAMNEYFDQVGADPSWLKLAGALLELHRSPDQPKFPPLDEIDIAVYWRAVAVLRGEIDLPDQLWRVLPIADLLGDVVGATYGRQDRLSAAREQLAQLRQEGHVVLSERLGSIVDGDREHDALLTGMDGADVDAIRCVLTHAAPQ